MFNDTSMKVPRLVQGMYGMGVMCNGGWWCMGCVCVWVFWNHPFHCWYFNWTSEWAMTENRNNNKRKEKKTVGCSIAEGNKMKTMLAFSRFEAFNTSLLSLRSVWNNCSRFIHFIQWQVYRLGIFIIPFDAVLEFKEIEREGERGTQMCYLKRHQN